MKRPTNNTVAFQKRGLGKDPTFKIFIVLITIILILLFSCAILLAVLWHQYD